MTWEAWVTLGVVGSVLFALSRSLYTPDVVLLGALTLLMTFSVFSDAFPGPRELASAFGNEGLLTVGVLFIVARGLTETGGLALLATRVLGRPASLRAAQARVMLPVAGFSAFLNNTPVVAMTIPLVGEWCKRIGISPSKLFIPLSYAAVLGGTCTLIGTSTNLIVHGLMIEAQRTDPTMPRFGMLTLGAVGVPVTLAGLLYVLLVSNRLLPDRKPFRTALADPREYTVEMLVEPYSPLEGRTIEEAGLRHLPGAYLASIERQGEPLVAVGPDQELRGDDRLIFVGIVDSVVDLQKIRGLVPSTDQVAKLSAPRHGRCLIEAVVSNTCPLVGRSIREGRFRSRYDAAVIAVHRNGERIDKKIGDIVLQPGDALLLQAHPGFARRQGNSRDFFLVSPVPDSQPRRHERAWIAIVILAGMVTAVSLERYTGLSVFNAALIAAGLMGLTGCISTDQARRSIDWGTLVAIGAALGVGRVVATTGLAQFTAQSLIDLFAPFGPIGVLAAVYVVTLLFTELVTNNAAAALAFPIASAAAAGLGVDFMPFAVVIAISASAGFATPLGYQTHLMVYGVGGYRFGDYVRIGIPLDLLVMMLTLTLAPRIFPF